MRFVIGIIAGSILTLFIATAADAPTHGTLDRARTELYQAWDGLIDTTSDSLFSNSRPVAVPNASTIDAAPREPAPTLAAPAATPAAPSAHSAPEQTELTAHKTDGPMEVVESRAPTSTPSLAPVWLPFHSQMSAEGFAARLSRELDHSFNVQRQRAGTYQVVFAAESAAEQELLLARVAEITGQ